MSRVDRSLAECSNVFQTSGAHRIGQQKTVQLGWHQITETDLMFILIRGGVQFFIGKLAQFRRTPRSSMVLGPPNTSGENEVLLHGVNQWLVLGGGAGMYGSFPFVSKNAWHPGQLNRSAGTSRP